MSLIVIVTCDPLEDAAWLDVLPGGKNCIWFVPGDIEENRLVPSHVVWKMSVIYIEVAMRSFFRLMKAIIPST